uniref:LisH domain-containing protein n=1 Tax=Meloidogyne hapla TaxID=6305 RepID=A0A1I8BUB7_MELHA
MRSESEILDNESNQKPTKAELVQLVNQFLLQNDLPVTAAALQKECEKLLGGRWNVNSNVTRSGRLRRHTTAIPTFDSDACLAEWLSDSGAVTTSASSPNEMTNSSSKSPPSRLRKPAKTTLKKGQSQNIENKNEASPAPSQKRTNSRQRTKNSSGQEKNENINVSPTKAEQKQVKIKNPLRKADSVGSIASTIAATETSPKQQPPPPPDPIHSSNVLISEDVVEDKNRWLCANLDLSLINQTLIRPSVSGGRSSALLLQAIRQVCFMLQVLVDMLTKTSITDGDANLSALIAKDLLQLRSRKQSIASALFHDDNTLAADNVREQLARLLNVIASFRRGRDYLLCSTTLNNNSNTNTSNYGQGRQQLIYECSQTLKVQQNNIRPAAQREFLINGIFEWICSQLAQQKFGQAGLEFGVALLHNLVVNPISQSMVIRHRKRLLDTLRILIGSARGGQALQYTCATLFILLCLPQVRKTARDSTDLERILIERAQREKTPEQIRQLVVLYLMLRGGTFPDYLEAEIDSTDPLVPGHSELFGKRLLIKNFLSRPLPPSLAKYYLPLSQFTIEEEGQRENVPGVVPVRRQPAVQPSSSSLSGSSPRKKPQPKRVSNKEASFILKPEREGGYVSGVLPLIRQVHFERTNTMSSHATFVVENNSRRPLLAYNGFDNGLRHKTCF